jgi:hypothetical protein
MGIMFTLLRKLSDMKEEIINELYLQSQIQRDTEWGENVTFFDYRKFAELIVDECLSLCEDERDLQQIKEYFGVK